MIEDIEGEVGMMAGPYRVLVVDDSSFMRQFISDFLSQDPEIVVVGTAANGQEAVNLVEALRPDVVTMDIEMPVMDGLTALRKIMNRCPTPVIMLSSYTREGAETTYRALEMGAVDFIAKPSGTISPDIELIRQEIIAKVKAAATVKPENLRSLWQAAPQFPPLEASLPARTPLTRVIAIGASTGGPRALQELLAGFPADLPAGVLIVQHMPPGFTRALAERLDKVSLLQVREAREGEELLPGMALVAPASYHLTLKRVGGRYVVRLNQDAPVNGHRPSVDVMMSSLAFLDLELIGVLLTGMGDDGVKGMAAVKKAGGITFAEDESTAVIYGMPRTAVEAGVVDYTLPLPQIAPAIVSLINKAKVKAGSS
ncbi:MAG: two-component system, chemotaxis family, protein-glutamate methylesterase/glutaminase [Eubacteriales bacterium]|nr:two-component system, chemotaxis family, protein-glutamate methylesterase/glutaminase [Eubacteriales bacterium]MDN5364734.1 two-component system, chemotaxis family, protein-glutamate methylesterase/glutaminase [Eubacteriales bacterium]